MGQTDLIPEWVWLAAIRSFEQQFGLPDGFINARNFPALNKREGKITVEELKQVCAGTVAGT